MTLNINSLFVVSFMSKSCVYCDKKPEAIEWRGFRWKLAQHVNLLQGKFDDKIQRFPRTGVSKWSGVIINWDINTLYCDKTAEAGIMLFSLEKSSWGFWFGLAFSLWRKISTKLKLNPNFHRRVKVISCFWPRSCACVSGYKKATV